jgi:hypothetical protein
MGMEVSAMGVCELCGNKFSIFSTHYTKDNLIVCDNCIRRVSLGDDQFYDHLQEHIGEITFEELKEYIKHPNEARKWDYSDKPIITKIGDVVFEDRKQIISIPCGPLNTMHQDYHYSQIYKYEYIENHSMVSTGGSGIGRAMVGGVLFGGAGAVVGAVTKRKKFSEVASNMYIRIVFIVDNKPVVETIQISDFFDTELSMDSLTYEIYIKRIEKIMYKLDEVYALSHEETHDTNSIQVPEIESKANETKTIYQIGDINFEFAQKNSLKKNSAEVWKKIVIFLRTKENTINEYTVVMNTIAGTNNCIATRKTNVELFNEAVKRVSHLMYEEEPIVFADEGLISHTAKNGYLITDKHIFFLKKKNIISFDLSTLFMISVGDISDAWCLNDAVEYIISFVPWNNLNQLAICMALILQLHADLVGTENHIIMKGI